MNGVTDDRPIGMKLREFDLDAPEASKDERLRFRSESRRASRQTYSAH